VKRYHSQIAGCHTACSIWTLVLTDCRMRARHVTATRITRAARCRSCVRTQGFGAGLDFSVGTFLDALGRDVQSFSCMRDVLPAILHQSEASPKAQRSPERRISFSLSPRLLTGIEDGLADPHVEWLLLQDGVTAQAGGVPIVSKSSCLRPSRLPPPFLHHHHHHHHHHQSPVTPPYSRNSSHYQLHSGALLPPPPSNPPGLLPPAIQVE